MSCEDEELEDENTMEMAQGNDGDLEPGAEPEDSRGMDGNNNSEEMQKRPVDQLDEEDGDAEWTLVKKRKTDSRGAQESENGNKDTSGGMTE
jgi:hypothetical protein